MENISIHKKVLKKYNTCVIAILVFCENRTTCNFKVFGSVIYCIEEKYFCVYYLCLPQVLLYLTNKLFYNTIFNYTSLIGISKVIINIMSCRVFKKIRMQLSSWCVETNWFHITYQKCFNYLQKIRFHKKSLSRGTNHSCNLIPSKLLCNYVQHSYTICC